jgi:photosystem II stability/assembly factor-like uncharacterized protein
MNINRRASGIMDKLSASIQYLTFFRKRTVDCGSSVFSGVPAVLIIIVSFVSIGSGYTFHGCAMAPNSDQGWVVTSDTPLVFHSWNGGINWEQQYIPTSYEFYDVFFIDSLKGWTGNHIAMIWHTSDGGLNWHWQSLGFAHFAFQLFFLDSLLGWVAADHAICIRTTDGGNLWNQIILEWLPSDTVFFYGVSFINSLKGWMCAGRYIDKFNGDTVFKKGQGYIVHSENGGDSWVLQKRDTIYDFFDVKFKDSLEGWVVGGNDSTMEACVYHTIDGGQSWNLQQLPQEAKYLWSLELIDGNKLWAVGRNGTIIHSSDGGNSWEMQNSGVDTTLYDVDFADSLRGIIAGDGVILYTRNAGDTWYQANIVGIESPEVSKSEFLISAPAYPNPFTEKTEIRRHPPISEIYIYNAGGKLVANRKPIATNNRLIWDGKNNTGKELPAGIYFYRFEKEGIKKMNKIVKLE